LLFLVGISTHPRRDSKKGIPIFVEVILKKREGEYEQPNEGDFLNDWKSSRRETVMMVYKLGGFQ
jgi:hypothetical protein